MDPDQSEQSKEVIGRIKSDGIKLVRVAWGDPHGASRAKTVTAKAFLGALKNGYNINVATATLDASGLVSSRPSLAVAAWGWTR